MSAKRCSIGLLRSISRVGRSIQGNMGLSSSRNIRARGGRAGCRSSWSWVVLLIRNELPVRRVGQQRQNGWAGAGRKGPDTAVAHGELAQRRVIAPEAVTHVGRRLGQLVPRTRRTAG